MTDAMKGPCQRSETADTNMGSHRCEVITIASGKGGTGKTFLAACLGYALQAADLRVCLVDTDFATQGLSLFILGPGAERGTARLREESSLYHMVDKWEEKDGEMPVPMTADREDESDHGVSYEIVISNKTFYDRRYSLGSKSEADIAKGLLKESMGAVTDRFRASYRCLMSRFFEQLRASRRYDYVIVDTRGGFSEFSLVPAVFSDSFFAVTEPDFTSIHQLAKLLTNVDLMSMEENRRPYLRGLIVNKATDGEEEKFRSMLEVQFGIEFSLSWVIPLDPRAVGVYKQQLIPYRVAPSLPFCNATLGAFTDSFDLVTQEWPREKKGKWRSLVRAVSEAKQAEEETKAESARESERRAQESERLLTETTARAKEAEGLVATLQEKIEGAKARLMEYEGAGTGNSDQIHDLKIRLVKSTTFQRVTTGAALLGLVLTIVLAVVFYRAGKVSQQGEYNALLAKYDALETATSRDLLLERIDQLTRAFAELQGRYDEAVSERNVLETTHKERKGSYNKSEMPKESTVDPPDPNTEEQSEKGEIEEE